VNETLKDHLKYDTNKTQNEQLMNKTFKDLWKYDTNKNKANN